MATNNADWLQPQSLPTKAKQLPVAAMPSTDNSAIFIGQLSPAPFFDLDIVDVMVRQFPRKFQAYIQPFTISSQALIPPVLPKFDWFVNPPDQTPSKTRSFARFHDFYNYCSFVEIPSSDDAYYRRYLNDTGQINATVNSV